MGQGWVDEVDGWVKGGLMGLMGLMGGTYWIDSHWMNSSH